MWVLRERLFSVQWLFASLCGSYCVHGLRVSSLCHIAHCQRLSVTMYGFWSGGSNVFCFFFHPSFSLIFLHHPFHLAIWFQLFACLIRAAIFHLTLAFVLICLSLQFYHKLLFWPYFILPQAFAFSFFLCSSLALVLFFRVSVYPSSHF